MSRYIDLRGLEEVQVLDLGGYYKYKVARCAHMINIVNTYHSGFCMDTANAPTKQHNVLAIAMAMATAMEPCKFSRFSADVPSGAIPAPGISAGEHLSKHPRISHGASNVPVWPVPRINPHKMDDISFRPCSTIY